MEYPLKEPVVRLFIALGASTAALATVWCYRYFTQRADPSDVVERAYDAHDRGHKDEAARLIQRVLRRDPENETALYLRVLIDLESRHRHPALVAEELRPLIPAMKRVGGTALLLAQAFLRRGEEKPARYWYDVARTDPGFERHLDAMPLRDALAMRLGGQERSYQ